MTLDEFLDESIKRSVVNGYTPTTLISLRSKIKTAPAMSRIVEMGGLNSGFTRLLDLGLFDWTLEAGVIKYSEQFAATTISCARERIETATIEKAKISTASRWCD